MMHNALKIGSVVLLKNEEGPPSEVRVKRHGRDSEGVYTEVEFETGQRLRVHRSALRPMPKKTSR